MTAELSELLGAHQACAWKQVGPCVWCTTHGLRLYQGDLPEGKRAVPQCAPDAHEWGDAGMGFYSQCDVCGFTEWHE